MKVLTIVISITVVMLSFHGCKAIEEAIQPSVIYPCSVGCGNDRITPPKGYVYYDGRVMSLAEFNQLTHQHIKLQQ